MIEFVCGRAASGKTEYLYCLAEKAAGKVFFIVPEQESQRREQNVLETFGRDAEVLSFRRLADTLMRTYGGGAKPRLGEVAALGILYRAVQSVKGKLRYYRKSADSVRFYEKLMGVMEDFAAYRVEGEKLLSCLESETLKAKYTDLLLIYESYSALRKAEYRDSFDDLDTVARLLSEHPFFEDATVLVDGFAGFTGQEYVILEKIFLQARDVAITLLADEKEPRLFAPTLSHLSRLSALCTSLGLRQKKTSLSPRTHAKTESLALVERELFSYRNVKAIPANDDSVRVFAAASPEAEVRLVAADIRARVLSGECRYRDIAVVSNVQREYEHTVITVFEELEIPLYADKKIDVLSKPLFSMLLHALDAVEKNYRYEDMFALAGTYLCGLDYEAVAKLQNYVYMWNIRGARWLEPFTQNPFGIDARESEALAAERLAEINGYRETLITPLAEFAEDTRADKGKALLAALWRLTENFGVAKKLGRLAAAEPKREEGEQWLKLYDLYIELLEQLALVLGESEISRKTLKSMLEVTLRGYRYGVPPATLDQVHFTDMIRSRSEKVRHMYVLGSMQDKLPATVSGSNMLTDADIRRFKEKDILLSKSSDAIAAEQLLCLYRTLSSATDSLTFTFPAYSVKGQPQAPGTPVRRLTDTLLGIQIQNDPQRVTHVSDLARIAVSGGQENLALCSYLKEHFSLDVSDWKRQKRQEENLPPELVAALYGKELSASQSRLESFVGCPFGYFLDYGLKLKETEPVSFAANLVGDFVHDGMEHLLAAVGESGDVSLWDETRTDAFLEQTAEQYCEEHFTQMRSPRFDSIYKRVKGAMKLLGHSVLHELRHSAFRPSATEYPFSGSIPLSGGFSARVNGFVDRVDAAELDGKTYIKVVDYKTGDKSMSLEKIYNGYQLQLPLYSFMLPEQPDYKGAEIMGMEYLLSGVPDFSEEDRCREPAALAAEFKRHGLFLDSPALLEKMDNTGGLYRNARVKKDGSFEYNASVASKEQLAALGRFVKEKTTELVSRMAAGEVSVCPMKKGVNACLYCSFSSICRFEYGKNKVQSYKKMSNREFFDAIGKEETE